MCAIPTLSHCMAKKLPWAFRSHCKTVAIATAVGSRKQTLPIPMLLHYNTGLILSPKMVSQLTGDYNVLAFQTTKKPLVPQVCCYLGYLPKENSAPKQSKRGKTLQHFTPRLLDWVTSVATAMLWYLETTPLWAGVLKATT